MGRRQETLSCLAVLLLAVPAFADELKVSLPDEVVGDGRTIVPIAVNGRPSSGGKDLPVLEVPVITCEGASSLAAAGTQLPALLATAATKHAAFACTARLRDVESKFQLRVRPPAAGLYATPAPPTKTTDGQARVETFVWDGKRQKRPGWLRAVASDGELDVGRDGALTVKLAGRAPRTVAVVMIDGPHAGVAFVPITGVTVLPVESEPGSTVAVWVAGTWYGPVPTNGKIAEVPIEVPSGVTHAVARSTDKKGYVTDAVIDLKIPARDRIAATAAQPNIGAGEATTLAVGIVGSDGRPGAPKLNVVASAERGSLEPVRALGGGLWSVRYTAPASQGADRVTFRIEGDDRAGTADVELEVRGIATRVELDVANTAVEPGSELSAVVRVFDAEGKPLRDPDLRGTLGGNQLEVVRGEQLVLRGKLPEKIPAGGVVPLEVISGTATARAEVRVGGVTNALVRVPMPVAPPLVAIGAWAGGGWVDNLGELSSPRASAGLAIGHAFGTLELALLAGVESLSSSDTSPLMLDGMTYDATRSITGIGVPITLRGRISLGRFGVLAGASLVPTRARVSLETGAQPPDEYAETVLGARGTLAGDVAVGPGRLLAGATFGRGSLDSGAVVGQIDGLAFFAAYEWWFGGYGE